MTLDTSTFETKEALFEHLKANKDSLIKAKKSAIKKTEPIQFSGSGQATTQKGASNEENTDEIRVKVVANAAFVLDHDMDVLIEGCYSETVEERKHMTPHLHDHIKSLDAKVGEVADIYTEQIENKALGLEAEGSTECLIFETDIMKSYNEKIFNQYKSGKINQHSIGLNYLKIDLAINDEGSPEEKAIYDKYIGKILNPKKAIEKGYFWAVEKIMLIENSSVLFGSNHATPTLEIAPKSIDKNSTSASQSSEKSIGKVQRLRIIQEQIKM